MMLKNIADPSCKLNDPRVRIVWSYIAQYAASTQNLKQILSSIKAFLHWLLQSVRSLENYIVKLTKSVLIAFFLKVVQKRSISA